VDAGERNAAVLDNAIRTTLAEATLGEIDYVEMVRADDLTAVSTVTGTCLVALAVRFGGVRLIDNLRVTV
jgi:pantoate--beta-alanine ligase